MLRIKGLMLLIALTSVGCTPENTISEQERTLQNTVDAEVAGTLFEADLTQQASYKVHKNGLVVIKFSQSVRPEVYTRVVQSLRANTKIPAVRAEQAGLEICPLR